ncbi:hypothetical protein B0H13DRAFT_1078240 [Mycena leptocephala]|nr:hypothetical protein B0H13DRAFT_1078240 [Mycena leptocephala]
MAFAGKAAGKDVGMWFGPSAVAGALRTLVGAFPATGPIYYETIKLLYTVPQSVGIADPRPPSSYYFVGVQGDGPFYLDPHHSRPAVPLRPFVGEQPRV